MTSSGYNVCYQYHIISHIPLLLLQYIRKLCIMQNVIIIEHFKQYHQFGHQFNAFTCIYGEIIDQGSPHT